MTGLSPDSISYMEGKIKQWTRQSRSIKKYVGVLGGRNKLKLEFFDDFTMKLQPVCRDINRLGYARSREEILKIMNNGTDPLFTFPFFSIVDVILSGLSDACGFRKQGDKLDKW